MRRGQSCTVGRAAEILGLPVSVVAGAIVEVLVEMNPGATVEIDHHAAHVEIALPPKAGGDKSQPN